MANADAMETGNPSSFQSSVFTSPSNVRFTGEALINVSRSSYHPVEPLNDNFR